MGAVHFSIDIDLVRFLRDRLPLATFVETGTYRGDSLDRVRPFFDRLHSVESSPKFFREASDRFSGDAAVEIHPRDSAEFLEKQSESFRKTPTLFWLDAHWCADEGTAGERSQCPLLRELAAIGTLHPRSVVLVDDFRFFLSPPNAPHDIREWPSLDEVLPALAALGENHRLMVCNDVGVFYPRILRDEIREFAHRNGVDWLVAIHKSREYDEILRQAREKDRFLREKDKEIADLARNLDRIHGHYREEKNALAAEIQRLTAIADERAHALERLDARMSEAFAELRSAHAAEMDRAEARFAHQRDRMAESEARYAESEARYADLEARNAELAVRNAELAGIADRQTEIIRQCERKRISRSVGGWIGWIVAAVRQGFCRHGERARHFFRPRLGSLCQHPPRPLTIPARYRRIPQRTDWPLLSLTTPSFLQATFIERTLKSVLDQRYSALEYVVQDGGSNDGTADILHKYDDFLHRWASERDGGQAEAINRGFAGTSGEIMAWLNSDDMLLPGALHCVADYFRRHPDVDVVYGHRILIDEEDREIGRWVLPPHDEKVLTWADYVPQETLFWRRRIWDRVGGRVDESFRFAMDWDLLLRFQDAGARIVRLPRFLGAFRVHTRQKTSAELAGLGESEMARLRRRSHGRIVRDTEILPNIRNYLAVHVLLTKLFRVGILRY